MISTCTSSLRLSNLCLAIWCPREVHSCSWLSKEPNVLEPTTGGRQRIQHIGRGWRIAAWVRVIVDVEGGSSDSHCTAEHKRDAENPGPGSPCALACDQAAEGTSGRTAKGEITVGICNLCYCQALLREIIHRSPQAQPSQPTKPDGVRDLGPKNTFGACYCLR